MPTKKPSPPTERGPFDDAMRTLHELWSDEDPLGSDAGVAENATKQEDSLHDDVIPAVPPLTDTTIIVAILFQKMYGLDFALDFDTDEDLALPRSVNPHAKDDHPLPDSEDLGETASPGPSNSGSPETSKSGDTSSGAVFPSGHIARDQPALAARRLKNNPFARLCYAATWAEAAVFPYYRAESKEEKALKTRDIAFIVGFDASVEAGLIDQWVISWEQGSYPKGAQSIRLFAPEGRRARSRALGELEKHLRVWVNLLNPDLERAYDEALQWQSARLRDLR